MLVAVVGAAHVVAMFGASVASCRGGQLEQLRSVDARALVFNHRGTSLSGMFPIVAPTPDSIYSAALEPLNAIDDTVFEWGHVFTNRRLRVGPE